MIWILLAGVGIIAWLFGAASFVWNGMRGLVFAIKFILLVLFGLPYIVVWTIAGFFDTHTWIWGIRIVFAFPLLIILCMPNLSREENDRAGVLGMLMEWLNPSLRQPPQKIGESIITMSDGKQYRSGLLGYEEVKP